MVNTIKAVTVEEVTPRYVAVRYGEGVTEVENLMGVAYPRQVLQKGDKGHIEYRDCGHIAAWFWMGKAGTAQ